MSKRIFASFFISLILAAAPALAAEKAVQKDEGSWIVLSGAVASTEGSEQFMLDYGDDTVRVELRDWTWADVPGEVREGDKVKVYGRVDKDTYKTATIQADSVYVENLGIHFHGGAGREAAFAGFSPEAHSPVIAGDLSVTGRVESIEDRTFTIDTGPREMTVDTSTMNYNPLKRPGLRNRSVQEEDLVTVNGQMSVGVFENRELNARTVVIRARAPIGMDQRGDTVQPPAPATQPKTIEP